MSETKLIAYYLPQYYEIEFNNKYWGKGHTEWTNTAKAKPLFKGHYQPHIPRDLGFYNLLMPESRKAQADLAQKYGIDGFCYWHYWFGKGKTIMEKPLEEVLKSKQPDFPFCLAWANHNWHNPSTKEIILKQEYHGEKDDIDHFYTLLPYFKDKRYMCVDNKPIFVFFEPTSIPNINSFIKLWNNLSYKEGLYGFYFIGISQTEEEYNQINKFNLDAINVVRLKDFIYKKNPFIERIKYTFKKYHNYRYHNYKYSEAAKYFISPQDTSEQNIPTIITGWDHSPRSNVNSLILTEYTPNQFESHLHDVFKVVSKKKNKLCFIKSWNEWGEGNHLEPDLKYGVSFLETLKKVKEMYD